MAKRLTAKQRAVANVMGQYRVQEFKKVTEDVVPCVYSALAIALYEKGWRYKRIEALFARSQEIWNEYCNDRGNMMDRCLNLTGIDVRTNEEIG